MALKIAQALHLKQSQKLVMTPQLQQAIKLLTLTHLEMSDHIQEEMVENPVIEEIGKEEYIEPSGEMKANPPENFDWQNYIEQFNSTSQTPVGKVVDTSSNSLNYENMISRERTLAEHLEWQLSMEDLTKKERNIAHLIIHNINDDGYLGISFEDIVTFSDGEDRELCLSIKEKILRLDPIGCGSSTLSECLLVQAQFKEERSPLLEKIIENHLLDLKNKRYKKIAESLGTAETIIRDLQNILKTFHPKPGRLITSPYTYYVVPDIYVMKEGGDFVVRVNDDGVPKLQISQYYKNLLIDQTNAQSKTHLYVQEKLKSAIWLFKSIQNRQKTIYRVARSIVSHQQNFFKKGPRFLRPLILKDIANEIGVHESTVSRVTSNKFMHTPIGLFELKYFFSSSIGEGSGGSLLSNELLKCKIKEMIQSENSQSPLSDQKISNFLLREDFKVARRTVAKYREMLNIASSSKRKRI